jgi:AcrR family transcriptional regulator
LVDAARSLVYQHGLDVSMVEVAAAAGVSNATRHRHFPTRESLLEAVFISFVDQLRRVLESVEDPSDAFLTLMRVSAHGTRQSPGLADLSARRGVLPELRRQLLSRAIELIAEPLRLAQEAGKVRADLTPQDYPLIMSMVGAIGESDGLVEGAGDHVERGLSVLFDGVSPRERPGG